MAQTWQLYRYDAISDLLASTDEAPTITAVEDQLVGLTEGLPIEGAFCELVQCGESEAVVHVCFDVGEESQLVSLTIGRHNDRFLIRSIEWGYPD